MHPVTRDIEERVGPGHAAMAFHTARSASPPAAGTRVLVLGSGFAGTTLTRALERRLPRDATITLLSRDNFITYNPLLPEVVGASILPSQVVAPVRQMLRRADFRMVTVTDVDTAAREVHYLGEGLGVMAYDHLVLAFGVGANLDMVRGMSRYALPLKTLGDALFLRNRLMVRLEQAELQPDRAARRWLTTFIVVGGGFSGVEVAGEIADFLRAASPYYAHCSEQDFRVVVLHATAHLLPELAPRLGDFAMRKMRKQGIEIHVNVKVSRVDDRGVILDNDERIEGGTVICTVGTHSNPLVQALGLPTERGRILTGPDMSIPGHGNLWAIGDCAAVPNALDGRISPPTAQFATRQALQLADNLARSLRGRPTRPFRYRAQGQLSSIGHNKAVAEIRGLRISGFPAWLLWRAVYLSKMPTLARKVRVFFEWTWGMLFPPDMVHLRFARTPRTSPAPIKEVVNG
ncbi:MAG: NAD(P)/FAD-dependent oxidoreductase [Gammaproteobacteria bacterium]|nr:NAD(P)/FAD-dependent oxidoreductase [Gammaproteobacteria bacterium]